MAGGCVGLSLAVAGGCVGSGTFWATAGLSAAGVVTGAALGCRMPFGAGGGVALVPGPLAQWASAWRQEPLAKVVALPWLPSLVELLVLWLLWLLALPLVDQSLAWLAAASVAALAVAALLSFFCLCYPPQLWSRLPWQDQEAHVAFFWPA